MKEKVLEILENITGSSEVRDNLNIDLFEEGLLDSMGTVQMLVSIEAECGISVAVSEFDREQWNTPQKIIMQLEQLHG